MEKKFDEWNSVKKSIHQTSRNVLFHEREIWWCSLGSNIGSEQDGNGASFVRPVLVMKRHNRELAFVIPLTRTEKNSRFYHVMLTNAVKGSRLVLSQLRTVSSSRFQDRISRVPESEFSKIKEKLITLNLANQNYKPPHRRGFRA